MMNIINKLIEQFNAAMKLSYNEMVFVEISKLN